MIARCSQPRDLLPGLTLTWHHKPWFGWKDGSIATNLSDITYEEYVRMVRLVLGHTLPRLEIMTERMAETPGVVFEQLSFLPKDQSTPRSCWIQACSKVNDKQKIILHDLWIGWACRLIPRELGTRRHAYPIHRSYKMFYYLSGIWTRVCIYLAALTTESSLADGKRR